MLMELLILGLVVSFGMNIYLLYTLYRFNEYVKGLEKEIKKLNKFWESIGIESIENTREEIEEAS